MDSILVTGSSRGIGRQIALQLASDGFEVVVHYNRQRDSAETVLAQIKAQSGRARLLKFDVSDRSEVADAINADIDGNGAYYGVVCNAGIARDNAFPALSADDWDSVIRTNLDGFYNVLQPVIMPMIRRRKPGRIITVASVAGIAGNRGQANYSAAKAGIIGATKALAIELAKRNITVNCVAPGLIETDMSKGMTIDDAIKMIPMRRLGKPAEVAALVSFLMSAGASYITRQVISVNGGII